jgi:hypothetical protein
MGKSGVKTPTGSRGGRGGNGGLGLAAKKVLTSPARFAFFTWMSAKSTAIPGWRRSGSDGGVR